MVTRDEADSMGLEVRAAVGLEETKIAPEFENLFAGELEPEETEIGEAIFD